MLPYPTLPDPMFGPCGAQVRLHMLQEAADVAALNAEGSLGPNERQRRLRWPERLRITQSSLAAQARGASLAWPLQAAWRVCICPCPPGCEEQEGSRKTTAPPNSAMCWASFLSCLIKAWL